METAVQNNNTAKATRQKTYPGKKFPHYEDPKWFSFYCPKKWNKPNGIRFRIAPASYFDNRAEIAIGLGWIDIRINLPIYSTWEDCEGYPEWGFYYHANSLVIEYGRDKKKFIHMPWNLEWVRTSNLRKDGTWEHEKKGDRKDFYEDKWKEIIWHETYPYQYTLRCGEVQERTATIKVEEREWRPRWFKWTSLFKKVSKTIAVDFNDEVGERTGSWKGGCLGCGYNMKDGELPEQTLRRMEKERKF